MVESCDGCSVPVYPLTVVHPSFCHRYRNNDCSIVPIATWEVMIRKVNGNP